MLAHPYNKMERFISSTFRGFTYVPSLSQEENWTNSAREFPSSIFLFLLKKKKGFQVGGGGHKLLHTAVYVFIALLYKVPSWDASWIRDQWPRCVSGPRVSAICRFHGDVGLNISHFTSIFPITIISS